MKIPENYDLKHLTIASRKDYRDTSELCKQYMTNLDKDLMYEPKDSDKINCYNGEKQVYYMPTLTDNVLCLPNNFAHIDNNPTMMLSDQQKHSNDQGSTNIKPGELHTVNDARNPLDPDPEKRNGDN